MLSSGTLSGSALSGTPGGAAGFVPPVTPVDGTFHGALAHWLYPNMIERERAALFAPDSAIRLYTLDPVTGEAVEATLVDHWSARRIPTIESSMREEWRFEITDPLITWDELVKVTHLRLLSGETGERQTFKVLQVENAMKPGHVYLLRCEAIDQQWP